MKKKQKQKPIRCDLCAHQYDVEYNTPWGLMTMHYCKNSTRQTGYGFVLTTKNGSCNNFKKRDNE